MIGVIDAGGGMRGVYSAGIYDYLLDNGIELDYCLGISAGAANMITFLAKQKGRNKRFYTDYILRKEYMSLDNALRHGSYLNVNYIYSTLSNRAGEDPVDYETFRESRAKYIVAATSAETGKPYYFTKADVSQDNYEILKASCSLPLACKPYPVNGRLYFDGGIAEPIPYRKAFGDGCDRLVVILTKPREFRRGRQANMPLLRLLLKKYPETIRAIEKRHIKYNAALDELEGLEAEGRALVVAPKDISGMKTLTRDLAAIGRLYEAGYADGGKIADFLRSTTSPQTAGFWP